MSKKQPKTHVELVLPIVLIGLVGFIAVIYFSSVVSTNSTSTVTKASRSTFLTPGDDILSLEEDLEKLGVDPASYLDP